MKPSDMPWKLSQSKTLNGYTFRIESADGLTIGEFYGSTNPMWDSVPGARQAQENARVVIDASCRIAELEKRCGFLQAKIDELMLEFCPEEMTHEQIEEWASHQVMSASSAESVVAKPEIESGKSIKIQGLQINSLTGKC